MRVLGRTVSWPLGGRRALALFVAAALSASLGVLGAREALAERPRARARPASLGCQTPPPPPPTASRCDGEGRPRIAAGEHSDWRAALPQGARAEVLASDDVDGDGAPDVVAAVTADCRPDGSEESTLLVVGYHRAGGWTVETLRPVMDAVEQYARVIVLGGERFVYHSVVHMTDENMGNVNAWRVRPGQPLEAVDMDGQDGTRGVRRVTVSRGGAAVIPCAAGRCALTWNAAARRIDATPVRRAGRRGPRR